MTEDVIRSQAGGAEQRKGCWRGCLVATMALLVLGVLGAAAFYFLGRAYLERQIPVWREQYPEVGLVLDLLQLGREPATVEPSLQVGAERVAGVNDKGEMPADIPLYPEPETETYSVSADQAVGFQRVSLDADAVSTYFATEMARHGWTPSAEQETTWGYLTIWRKDARTCQVEIVATEGSSEIWIRYRG